MNLDPLVPWVSFTAIALALGNTITGFFTSGSKKNSEELAKVRTAMAEHDRRIQTLEGELKHLPDRDSTHRMELAMEKINGRLDTLNETLKPIKATNERLNELLVEQARK